MYGQNVIFIYSEKLQKWLKTDYHLHKKISPLFLLLKQAFIKKAQTENTKESKVFRENF